MLKTVIMTGFCILSAMGAVSLVHIFILEVLRRPKGEIPCHTAILLKEGETAEGYIRWALTERALSGFFEGEPIIAVCDKAEVEGLAVLRTLEREHQNLIVLNREQYIQYIKEHT